MKKYILFCFMSCLTLSASAAGLTVLPATDANGPITVFYPSSAAAVTVTRGPFTLSVAVDSVPERGNGRLIVLSHGSGGAPWVHTDLAQALVAAGFIVAVPEHAGDNWHDQSKVGPASWKLRPMEISQAIGAMSQDARFAPLFDPNKVGVWGMSAGGHTALALAGGRWSPAQLLAHCEAHLAEDFAACTGAATELKGSGWDSIKKSVAMFFIRRNLRNDTQWYGHIDPRIAAIVAGVPFAADFDMATLTQPIVPLGLVQAEQDLWLRPQFHSAAVMTACTSCEILASLPTAGHGALLAPLPPDIAPKFQRVLQDPPGFNRSELPALYQRTTEFFKAKLSAAQ